jgi:oligopeptide transport system ATP-binding protein
MRSTPAAEPPVPADVVPLLAIRDLHIVFDTDRGTVDAVRGIDIDVPRGAIVGLVGESGSGKSATSLAVLRLMHARGRIASGSITFDGTNLLAASRRTMQAMRGRRMSLVPQDPMSALNPGLRVGTQLGIAIRAHRSLSAPDLRAASIELLERVHLPDPERLLRRYPHEISGGQRQRIVIGMALVGGADLLIADEATTALDATTQLQILKLLKELQESSGLSILLITHDFGVVDAICDEVYVMRRGVVVEHGAVEKVFRDPQDAYTRELMSFIPDPAQRGAALGSTIGEGR